MLEMKTLYFPLLFGVFILWTPLCHSQVSVGLGLGGSFAGQYFFRSGVETSWHVHPSWSIRTELAVAQRRNSALTFLLSQGDDNYLEVNQTFMEWPLMVEGRFRLKTWNFYGFTGPQFCWVLKLQTWLEDEQGEWMSGSPDPNQLGIRKMDIGWVSGIGVEKQFTQSLGLFTEFRYYLGLREQMLADQQSLYNQGHLFQIGARFLIGKKGRPNAQYLKSKASDPTGN